MDRQNSAATQPDAPARPLHPTSGSGAAALPDDDEHRACSVAQAVVAIALDQITPIPPRAAAFARQVAMYLAHVGFGLSMAAIGRAFGRDRTTVLHACHLIEDRRDDVQFDRLLELLEQSAIALHAADRIHRKG